MGNSNYIGTRINTTSIKRIYEHCDPETETKKLSLLRTTSPNMESISSTQ
jgi:hypothetical protein